MKRPNIDISRSLRKNQTDAEKKLWSVLRNRQLKNVKFRRQFPIDQFILDFYAPEVKLVVEADGGQHFDETGLRQDEQRTARLNALGITVLRFNNRDVLTNLEGVLETISRAIPTGRDAGGGCTGKG